MDVPIVESSDSTSMRLWPTRLHGAGTVLGLALEERRAKQVLLATLDQTASDKLAKLKSFTRIGGAGDPASAASGLPMSSILFSICTML